MDIERVLTDRMGEYFRPPGYAGDSWKLNPADLAVVVREIVNDHMLSVLADAQAEVHPGLRDQRVYDCCGCGSYEAIYEDMRAIVLRHMQDEAPATR